LSEVNFTDVSQEYDRIRKAGRLHWFHWLILAGSLALTFSAWYFTYRQAQQKIEGQFNRQTAHVIELISERMQKYEDALWGGVAAIHSHSFSIDYKKWKDFAETLQIEEKYSGINGIGVIYYIPDDQLSIFLKTEQESRPEFTIHPNHEKNIFLPITYIEPIASNARALGLDMAHEINRFTAAIKARDSGKAQITGPIILVQDSEKTAGFLFYAPFYKGGHNNNRTLAQRQENFMGLVYAPFIFKRLLQGTLDEDKRSINLRIGDSDNVLYDELTSENIDFDPKPLFKQTISVDIYGRQWDFSVWTSHTFRKQNQNNQPMIILISGIFIDSLLLLLFFSIAKSNRQTINFAYRITQGYQQKTIALEHANSELEEFSYRTAHDLRSPLLSIAGLLNVAKKSITTDDTGAALSSIDLAEETLVRLKILTKDILLLSEEKNINENITEINIKETINATIKNISYMENLDQLIIKNTIPENYTLKTKPTCFNTIIENLLSNAIKYQDIEKENSFVKISAQEEGKNFIIVVSDNGLGIPKDYQDQLFNMFKRFHPQTSHGSGLGLYMIRKSASMIGGEIGYKDTEGGSIFFVKLPIGMIKI
jgi:CHASE1-domain containing sensor protein/two-component sensor histidine kinase